MSTGSNAPLPSDLGERVRSNNAAASPGVRLQFKSPTTRNVTHGNRVDRNVSKHHVDCKGKMFFLLDLFFSLLLGKHM